MAIAGYCHGPAEFGVPLDGLPQENQRPLGRFPFILPYVGQGTQIQIICGKIAGGPRDGSFDFGSFQSWLDDASDT